MKKNKLLLYIVLIMNILSFAGCGNADQSIPISTSTNNSTAIATSTPEVPTEYFQSLYATTNSSFGITSSGSLYSWGSNDEGCLGVNSTESTLPIPTKVLLPEKVLDLAPGVFSVALTESGKVYTWGITAFGIEGVGRTYESAKG